MAQVCAWVGSLRLAGSGQCLLQSSQVHMSQQDAAQNSRNSAVPENGPNGLRFRPWLVSEAPAEWTGPVPIGIQAANASNLGIPLEDLRDYLCVEVPDTTWRLAYQTYIVGLDDTRFLPVLVSNVDDFAAAGRKRLRGFNRAVVVSGRPCHFARVFGAAHYNDGEQ
jgi:hypothetical protein